MRIALELLLPYIQFLEHGGQQAIADLRPLDAAEVQSAMAALSFRPAEPELQAGVPLVPRGTADELRSVSI